MVKEEAYNFKSTNYMDWIKRSEENYGSKSSY